MMLFHVWTHVAGDANVLLDPREEVIFLVPVVFVDEETPCVDEGCEVFDILWLADIGSLEVDAVEDTNDVGVDKGHFIREAD